MTVLDNYEQWLQEKKSPKMLTTWARNVEFAPT
jgi:hypothetical protein